MTAFVRVIGLGHPDRGDDAVGLDVLDHLRPEAFDVVRGAADAAGLLAQLEDVAAAVVVDCARGGGAPGSILRLPADFARWPQQRTTSHGNALADALALGTVLGGLPPRLTVFAVVGDSFGLGEPLSPAVRDAVPDLAALVLREAREMAGGR